MRKPSDRFERPVYFSASTDIFLTVDRRGGATADDLVVTEDRGDSINVEWYHYQQHYGVVTVLQFYRLEHSEQWTPARHCLK
jgi:hypothetical protein